MAGEVAAVAIATVTTLSTAFETSAAGVLINLGGHSMLDSARYLMFGFAAMYAIGIVTARIAERSQHTDTAAG